MIKPATEADLPRVADMALKFVTAAGLPHAQADKMAGFVRQIFDNPNGFIAVSKGGFIGGLLAPLYYNPDHLEAHELAWWSEDGQGLSLLAEFEEWARKSGAKQIVLSTLATTDARALKLLARRGFVAGEISHRKAI